jgi:hypothetical protein
MLPDCSIKGLFVAKVVVDRCFVRFRGPADYLMRRIAVPFLAECIAGCFYDPAPSAFTVTSDSHRRMLLEAHRTQAYEFPQYYGATVPNQKHPHGSGMAFAASPNSTKQLI